MENPIVWSILSSLITATATIIVGVSAFIVYRIQLKDKKKTAAKLVLSEVRNAEKRVVQISEIMKSRDQDLPRVLSVNSWKQYAHYFVSDFDKDQFEEINSFFHICEELDEYVQRENSFFWITAGRRAEIVQEKLAEIINLSFDVEKGSFDEEKVESIITNVLDKYTNHQYSYSPGKTVTYLSDLVDRFRPILTTTTGSVLKKLAIDNK